MEVFLVRHAIAVERGSELADEARPLTPEGMAKFSRVVRGLRRLSIRFDTLCHSPWTRAVETADLLMPLLDGESIVDARLAGAPGKDLIDSLSGKLVALVGHEPWMSELIALLTQGKKGKPSCEMRKGGVAWLRGAPTIGGMHLVALLPPRVLRRVG
jgi:phosphohistidine phosphatase